MIAQSPILVLIMGTAGTIASVIAWYSWGRKSNIPGGYYFSLLMLAVAVFSFTGAGEFTTISIDSKITWSTLSYLGVVSVAPLWLLFSLSYSRRPRELTFRWIAWLWLVPLITFGLALTNNWHGFLWPTITPLSSMPGSRLIYTHGIAWWIHASYAYFLMFLGTYWLISNACKSSLFQRKRVGVLIVAALIPWFGNFLYLADWNPFPGLVLTLLGFVITGLILVFCIFKFKIFDFMPVAYEVVFNNISDAVIVINNQNQLVNLNFVASSWIGNHEDVVGRNVFEILPLDMETVYKCENSSDGHFQIDLGEGIAESIHDLTISPCRV